MGFAKHFFTPLKSWGVAKTASLFNPSRLRMSPAFKNAADQGPAFQQESSESDQLWQKAAAGEPQVEQGVTHPRCFSAHQPMQKGMQGSIAALLLLTTAPGCPAAPILSPPSYTSSPFPHTTGPGNGAHVVARGLFSCLRVERITALIWVRQKRSCATVWVPGLLREGSFATRATFPQRAQP